MTLVPVNTPNAMESIAYAETAWQVAQKIARTEFVPEALRTKPEAVLACMMTGYEVGIGPMQALSKIHVIKGRPTMAAELMRALVLRAGHELHVEESNSTQCTMVAKRAGEQRETRMTFTMDDAKRAKVDGKDPWRQYPQAMLIARVTSMLCRTVFPDVLAGLSYSAEEVDSGLDEELVDEATTGAPPKATTGKTRKARAAITAAPQPADAPNEPVKPELVDVPPLPGEDGFEDAEGPDQDLTAADVGPSLPWPQMAGMKASQAGVPDDDARHGLWLALTAGRTAKAAELLPTERTAVLDVLAKIGAGIYALAYAAVDEGQELFVVIDAEGSDGILWASMDAPDGTVFTILAPASYHGMTFPGQAPETGQESPQDAQDGQAPPAAPQPAPKAPETPAPPATEATAPSSSDAWRAWLRDRKLKVGDALRTANEVGTELRIGDANVPRSLDALAAMDEGFRATVLQRLAG
jgi:hypothetical protein